MGYQSAFRECLVACDVDRAVSIWSHVFPNMPKPETRDQAEIVLHVTRTLSESIDLKHRAYSHRWLLERNLPSKLPDHLKTKAERMYPKIVDAVGVMVVSKHPEVVREVRGAMCAVVEDCYANNDKDPAIVKPRMMEARSKALKRLYG